MLARPWRGFVVASSFALTWLSIGAADGCIWELPRTARELLIRAPLLLLVLVAAVRLVAAGARPRWPGAACAVAGLLVVGCADAPAAQVAGACAVLLGLDGLFTRATSRRGILGDCGVAALAFAVFRELRAIAWGHDAWDGVAATVSHGVSALLGEHVQLGPTALGLEFTVLLAALIVASGNWREPLTRWVGVVSLALALTLPCAHGFALCARAQRERPFTLEAFEEPVSAWFTGLWVCYGAGVALVALHAAWHALPRPSGAAESPARLARAHWRRASIACAIGAAALLGLAQGRRTTARLADASLLVVGAPERPNPERAAQSGYYEHDDFLLVPRLLRGAGCTVETAPSQRLASLRAGEFDAVVLVHPALPDADGATRLREFVAAGGGLLLITDHTPSEADRAALAALLADTGIEVCFDAAFTHAVAVHEIARADESELGRSVWRAPADEYGVGASLAVRAPAEVVLELLFGVGDRGHASSPSLLGNRHYENGDRLGDLPVVARSTLGRGAVVVVGDTGALLDSALPYTYPFLLEAAREVARPVHGLGGAARAVGTIAGALLALLAASGAPMCGALALVIAALAPTWIWPRPAYSIGAAAPAFVVELEGAPLCAGLGRDPRSSLKGFAGRLTQHGDLPLVRARGVDLRVERPRGRLIVGCTRPLGAAREAELRSELRAGLDLWISAGAEEARSVAALLAAEGVRVLRQPLGNARMRVDTKLGTGAAAEVAFAEGWSLELPAVAHVELAYEGLPIAASAAAGAGRLVVVADSYFLCDDNLEAGNGARDANVAFVDALLERAP